MILDIVSFFIPALSAFFAGYWRGRVVEQREWMNKVGPELKRLEEMVVLREMMARK